MQRVADALEKHRPPQVSAVLCVETDALDRFGPILRHLLVGLVDQAIPLRLAGSDPRIESLRLGPIQTVLHPPFRWPHSSRRIDRLLDALSPQAPTVVHAMSSASYRTASAVAEEFDADLVLQVTSLTDCERVAQSPWPDTTHHHAFSQPLASLLETQIHVAAQRIEVIPPGVPVSGRPACFVQPQRVPTLLCTSRMVRSSAVDSLIDAVGSLVSRGYGLQLFILAGGPLEGALRRHVRVRQLSGHVTFASEMADPTLAMAGADIFIRPSADTAFTADSLQALAAGMAVVSLPNSAADHLRPGETAFVCSQNTTEALAATIESVLRDRSDAQRLAAAGMDYVRRHHGVSAMAERTAAAYRKLLLARTTFAMQG